jgi:predicted TIM-barrel fold metal-dependent hydrolase
VGASRRPIPCYYPLYAKCIELDVAFQTQVGHTGRCFRPRPAGPIYIDQVALDFPELRIICGHIGWPWTEEMIAGRLEARQRLHRHLGARAQALSRRVRPLHEDLRQEEGAASPPTIRCCPSIAS